MQGDAGVVHVYGQLVSAKVTYLTLIQFAHLLCRAECGMVTSKWSQRGGCYVGSRTAQDWCPKYTCSNTHPHRGVTYGFCAMKV